MPTTIKYLDNNGLSHFWDKIDAKKQNKLTAGSNITIDQSTNTISATTSANTFASYSNGTLYITNNATNADTENF